MNIIKGCGKMRNACRLSACCGTPRVRTNCHGRRQFLLWWQYDVVGALTPVVGGVAQVFHDLLVELRLLLVAEVEEGEKEDRQEEGEEVKGGSQVEETTTTWMVMKME